MDDIKLIAPLQKVDGRAHKRVTIRPQHVRLYAELQKPEHRGMISKAMEAVGYPASMQDRPAKVTDTKSWQALLQEHLPEDLLARRHEELLNKREGTYVTYGRGKNRKVEFIDKGPDTSAVTRGLEMAYKLRGSFVAEPTLPPSQVVYNLFYKPEVRAQLSAFEDQLKKAIAHDVSTIPDSARVVAPTAYVDESPAPGGDNQSGQSGDAGPTPTPGA